MLSQENKCIEQTEGEEKERVVDQEPGESCDATALLYLRQATVMDMRLTMHNKLSWMISRTQDGIRRRHTLRQAFQMLQRGRGWMFLDHAASLCRYEIGKLFRVVKFHIPFIISLFSQGS
jgi:hypothetical protein